MRCLVTGASGHLGSCLIKCLLRHNNEVFGLVRPESDLWRLKAASGPLSLLFGDLANTDSLRAAVADARPDVVFHLGWHGVTSEFRNDPRQISCNVAAVMALVEGAKAAGCGCWIGVGSQAEYGPYAGALHEDLPTRPITAYGVAKLCSGLLAQKMCELEGMRCVWLRLLATYGPADDARHLIPSIIRQMLEGAAPALTPGEQRCDYLYVTDAVDAIYRAAVSPTAKGVFNLGSGQAVPLREIVEQIRDLVQPDLPIRFGALPYRPDQVMHLQADTSALRAATGWTPTVSLQAGLRNTAEWYRSSGARQT